MKLFGKHLTLRAQLLLGILVAAQIPVSLLVFLTLTSTRESIFDAEYEKLQATSQQVNAEVGNLFRTVQKHLDRWSVDPMLNDSATPVEARNRELSDLSRNVNGIEEVQIVSASPEIVTGISMELSMEPFLDWYQPLDKTNEFLHLRLKLPAIWKLTDRHQLSKNGGVIVLNENLEVIAHRDKSQLRTRVTSIFRKKDKTMLEGAYGEQFFVVASRFLPSNQAKRSWTILCAYPEKPINELVMSAVLRQALIGLLALMLALGFGLFLSAKLSGGVLRTSDAALQMAGGDLSARAEVRGSREIQQLASAFNEMAATVETHQKHLSDLVQAKTAQLTAIHDASNEGIWVVTASGETLLMNRAMQALFKISEDSPEHGDEITNRITSIFSNPDEFQQWFQNALSSDIPVESIRWELSALKDGVIASYSSPIRDNQGNVIASLFVFSDLTEETRLQKRYEAANQMERIGNLSGAIAHEFNNLLTVVKGNLEILTADVQSEDGQKSLRAAMDSSSRAVEIVQGMLSFSQRDWIDSQLIETTNLLPKEESSDEIRIISHMEPDTWNLIGDESKIRKVFDELITNARESFTKPGEIRVSARNYDELVVNNEEGSQQFVEFSVVDTGEMIPQDVLEHVFDPFYSTKPGQKGLGLASCHGAVSQHNGWMTIDSEPGRTEVKFVLPASVSDPQDVVPTFRLDSDEPQKRGSKILVVDDDDMVRRVTQAILKKGGYEVVAVDGGARALEIFREQEDEFQLVVLDLKMPRMMGTEVFEKLRQNHHFVPVIICSGYLKDFDTVKTTSGDKPQAFLEKPVSCAEMLSTIDRILNMC